MGDGLIRGTASYGGRSHTGETEERVLETGADASRSG